MVRTKGTGSVFPLPSGKWRGQIQAGYTASGARRYITVTGKSEADAARKLRAKVNEISTNGVPQARATTLTVLKWSQTWLPIYKEKVRPNRFTDVRGVVRKYIVPAIGHKRMVSLTPADVREVHRATEQSGYGPATSLRTHDALMVMLKAAQKDGINVPGNVLLVDRPKMPESDRDAIPIEDAWAILRAATERPDASRWVAAFLQGMRQGECLGLTWDCVDLERGTIDVSWQLQAIPYEDRSAGTFRVPSSYTHRQLSGQMHLVRPKSSSGTRVIPLVPPMMRALVAWRELSPANDHGLVWTESGRPIRKHTDRANWFELQDAAQVACVDGKQGRRYTLHQARHTCATLLLEGGVDQHVVTAILGHSQIATSRGYQHVSQAMARKALEDVAERLQLRA